MVLEQGYEQFSQGLHRQVLEQHTPVSGTIELTRRCPLDCAHCYNNLPMGDTEARTAELSTDEHYRLLDEISEAGCLWLCYTGGEILARPDFLPIYTRAKERGMILTLFTNATLLTPRIADHLAQYRPFCVEVTLYGATRETYETLTGIPGSYDRCHRGIELLLERGLPLKLKTVGTTITRPEIPAMREFARGLGLELKFDSLINPRVDCSQTPLDVRLRPADVVALDLEDPVRVQAWRDMGALITGHVLPPSDEVYFCGGGVNSFAVDPYGGMSICILSEQDKYDLRRGTFREGWSQFLHAVRHQKRKQYTQCATCEIKEMCGMCPAMGELENGDKEAPVDFLCHTAHLRARTFGIQVPPHGDCPYCEGGSRVSELDRSSALLAQLTRPETLAPRHWTPLPMHTAPATASACGGCR